MPDLRRVLHLWLADFRQRFRSRRLVLVYVGVAALGYAVNVGDIDLILSGVQGSTSYRGAPTAEWTGIKAGLTASSAFLIGGFYLLSGRVGFDADSGVGRLIASTPTTDREYLLGKWLSGVTLSVVILVVLAGATVVNHFVHGTGATDPVALTVPIFLFGLPVAAAVTGVTLVFDTTPFLGGTVGSVVYFFVAATVTSLQSLIILASDVAALQVIAQIADVAGYYAAYDVTLGAGRELLPDVSQPVLSFGVIAGGATTFTWEGAPWPAWVFAQRAGFFLVGGVVATAAVLGFDRFAPNSGVGDLEFPTVEDLLGDDGDTPAAPADDPPTVAEVSPTPVTDAAAGSFGRFRRLFGAEFRLATRELPIWWWGVVLLVGLGSLVPLIPASLVRRWAVPIALVLPLFVWSGAAVRPARFRTKQLLFSSPSPVGQLLTEWAVGVTIAVAVLVGPGVRLAFAEPTVLLGLLGAVAFVPSLALLSGVLSEGRRLFEIVYLSVWYIGPFNGGVPMDFAGVAPEALETGVPLFYAGAGVVTLLAAVAVRARQTV